MVPGFAVVLSDAAEQFAGSAFAFAGDHLYIFGVNADSLCHGAVCFEVEILSALIGGNQSHHCSFVFRYAGAAGQSGRHFVQPLHHPQPGNRQHRPGTGGPVKAVGFFAGLRQGKPLSFPAAVSATSAKQSTGFWQAIDRPALPAANEWSST